MKHVVLLSVVTASIAFTMYHHMLVVQENGKMNNNSISLVGQAKAPSPGSFFFEVIALL